MSNTPKTTSQQRINMKKKEEKELAQNYYYNVIMKAAKEKLNSIMKIKWKFTKRAPD